ncbi:agamous-like MADS-box protein AGL62 [Lotus japonicus]|uniref:agamous-like MADS-box protein AGL62 n=1 Tax=Lotus japonicus TaxID=34305 RepID=UPI00258DEF0C|nr:agamous-like MADS-box protein AGL62 [Lotus japonicus]
MSTGETSTKKGNGRRKIEMKKITNPSSLQVAFSKRRSGLFKKVNELGILCGGESAFIIFSPSGKVFSFGHPSVDSVIQRYLSEAPQQTSNDMRYIEVQRSVNVQVLSGQLTKINNHLEDGKKIDEELNCLLKAAFGQFGWACQVEEMDLSQLVRFKRALNELKKDVTDHGSVVAATNPPTHQFFDVSGGLANNIIPFNHPPPTLPQTFQEQLFQGPMMQAHNLFGSNSMGGYGGPSGSF